MKKLVTVLAGLALATPALADDYREQITEVVTGTPQPESGFGVSVNVGGGVSGFSDSAMRAVTNDAGGAWTARVSLGTRSLIGLDVAYIGTATDINRFDTLNNNDNARLIGTDVEAAVRLNLMPKEAWTPYAFAGAGWQHYSITNEDNTRGLTAVGLSDNDNIAVFPLGGGLSYRDPSGLNVDVRGAYRFAQDSDIIRDSNGNRANLGTWEASGSLGFEF